MPTLEYRPPAPPTSMSPIIPAALACAAGIVGNLWSYLAASLRHAPRGISIRPMGLEAALILIAFGTFTVALPSAVAAIILGRRRPGVWLAGVVGAILSLTPWRSG